MSYEKQTWVDGETPLDAEHLNHMEQGIEDSVSTTEQTLSDAQKAQARENIGALSEEDVDDVLQRAKDSGEFDGADGQRGTGILKVTSSLTTYTTETNGVTPIKRMALSTIISQSGVSEVLVGDCICYSYYLYHIYYVDDTYAYCDKSQSIRGATGAAGAAGSDGADGKTPVKGVDYFTEADKAEIVATVMDSIGCPVFGVVDENNVIMLSGKLAEETYQVKYEMEDGSVVDIGELSFVSDAGYTNLADPTSEDWSTDCRLSTSAGTVKTGVADHIVTNFIPATIGDVLRVKGLDIVGSYVSSNYAVIALYKADETYQQFVLGVTGSSSSDAGGDNMTVDGDITTVTLLSTTAGTQRATSETAYIRIDAPLIDGYTAEDVIITINEEIV